MNKQKYFIHDNPYYYSKSPGTYAHGFKLGKRTTQQRPVIYSDEYSSKSAYCRGYNDGVNYARLQKLIANG